MATPSLPLSRFSIAPMRRVRPLVVAGIMMLALTGCFGNQAPIGSGTGASLVSADALPAPDALDTMSTARPFVISPLDKLRIDVLGIPELSQRSIQVDPQGNISLPITGTIAASGKAPDQLQAEIRQRLIAGYVRDPRVAVNVEEAHAQLVTVDGEVRTPGVYPIVGNMTLIRAIALANGTGEFAKLTDVVVFRTVDGQRYAALYNLGAIRRGNYPDPFIYPNDVIVVNDSRSRRIFKDFLQIVPLLTTPIIVALQR